MRIRQQKMTKRFCGSVFHQKVVYKFLCLNHFFDHCSPSCYGKEVLQIISFSFSCLLLLRANYQAYENIALPIGENQTISQPYVVAKMTELLEVENNHKVLEIGTGSGYQCAVLSKLARRIYTIERIKNLHDKSCKIFEQLNLTNIVSKYEDGNNGWVEQIPFDRIIFTAATENITERIFSHIKNSRRSNFSQSLLLIS